MSSNRKSNINSEDASIVQLNDQIIESDDCDEERSMIRAELSTMSFEDLIKIKEKLGSKFYKEAMFGKKDRVKRLVKKEYKRENKNRPREMSAKRPVPLLGNVKSKVNDEATTSRDPRFDPNCGEYDPTKFKENFRFVADIKEKELVELKERFKQSKDAKEKKKWQYLIQRMENQNLEAKKLKAREQLVDEEKQNIQKAKKELRMPRYSNNSEKKARELVQQYTELKESGKLNKHLEKRRKKNVTRDRKKNCFD